MNGSLLDMCLSLVAATLLGALVGLQRERSGRPAGLRTHALVCLGSALVTLVSESYPDDPARISAQIVSGIGFLGAGTIIREGYTVRGLTTAASLWAVAGLGIACGRGGDILLLGVVATLLMLLTLGLGKRLEDQTVRARQRDTLSVRAEVDAIPRVTHAVAEAGATVETATQVRTEGGPVVLVLRLRIPSRVDRGRLLQTVLTTPGVQTATWVGPRKDPDEA